MAEQILLTDEQIVDVVEAHWVECRNVGALDMAGADRAIAKAQLRKVADWFERKVEENFVVYAHETTVVEDRVALPIEDWQAFKEAASA